MPGRVVQKLLVRPIARIKQIIRWMDGLFLEDGHCGQMDGFYGNLSTQVVAISWLE